MARFEDLIDRIRELARDPGRSELLRSSLTWFSSSGEKSLGPFRVITVTVRDGVTTLTASERLGQLAGAIYGGVGGGVGGGGLALPLAASIAVPVLAPVFMVGWLGGVFLGARALYRRAARRRAIALEQLHLALADEIERLEELAGASLEDQREIIRLCCLAAALADDAIAGTINTAGQFHALFGNK